MHFKKRIYILLVLLLTCSAGMAQLTTAFSFSAISSAGANMGVSTPILFDAQSKCLSVSNGVSLLSVANNGSGLFNTACKEVPPTAPPPAAISLSLTVYPNPTRGMSLLKCKGSFDPSLSCTVRVIGLDGRMIMNQVVSMVTLQTGWMIDLSSYAAGTYSVNVELMRQQYSLKLVKL